MSHFLGATVIPIKSKSQGLENLASIFDERIRLVSIDRTPFGAAVVGGAKNRFPFGLIYRGTSTDLIAAGYIKDSLADECVAGLSKLIKMFGGISILLHFFHGDVLTEFVDLKDKVVLGFPDFVAIFPEIQEDVRYTITY